MTVKKNNRLIFDLAAILLIIGLSVRAEAVQKKNILRVWFQTAFVKPSTSDTVLNVYYKLEVGRPPVNFHGFDLRFIFENTKIQPVPMNQGFFSGTACANADYAHGTAVPPDEYRVQVLSSANLDTSNPVLFQVRYSVKGINDSAMIIPTLFDVSSSTSGIDTVIIENSPGRDQISWYGFGLIFKDTAKFIPPPKKKSITLLSDSTDIQSDSIKIIAVNVSALDDTTNLKSGIFGFDLDTSAFDSVAVLKGALLSKANLVVSRDSTHISASFSGADTIKGSGEFLKIVLRGKKRTDTLCTNLLNPKLSVSNGDNHVALVAYKLQGICVLGKKDTVVKGVVEGKRDGDVQVKIFPNPSSSFIDFHAFGQDKKHIIVSDALGREVLDTVIDADFHWDIASISAGYYTATVISHSALNNGLVAEKTKILIIH